MLSVDLISNPESRVRPRNRFWRLVLRELPDGLRRAAFVYRTACAVPLLFTGQLTMCRFWLPNGSRRAAFGCARALVVEAGFASFVWGVLAEVKIDAGGVKKL